MGKKMKKLIEMIQGLLFLVAVPKKYKDMIETWEKTHAELRRRIFDTGLSTEEAREFLRRDPNQVLIDFIACNWRAVKLLARNERFIVVRDDEPYFQQVYEMIRKEQQRKGWWNTNDEIAFVDAVKKEIPY